MFRRLPTLLAGASARPTFEVHRLMDNPEDGHLTRVTYVKERASVVVSRFPQLGPRKEDPSDDVPQFDVNRRMSARFTVPEVATMLAVLESRVESAKITNPGVEATAARDGDGFALNGVAFTGPRSERKENDFKVSFDKTRTTQLYHFLEASLKDSLGFKH
uniref:SUN domain-containing protein n=1 Tax=Neobodo designis TaxID=312471 RepID=A0A7S1QAT5_NEODS|mmetsp:Transcript_36548/g.112597  ORF Transcript_36548/g.112597 Transcript_36548/m.112597 type:complete len:161 (+) Transcript_36548:44-526(+)